MLPIETIVSNQMWDALAECERAYLTRGLNVRMATERVEELWFMMEDEINAMEEFERTEDERGMEACHERLQALTYRVEAELPPEYARFA